MVTIQRALSPEGEAWKVSVQVDKEGPVYSERFFINVWGHPAFEFKQFRDALKDWLLTLPAHVLEVVETEIVPILRDAAMSLAHRKPW